MTVRWRLLLTLGGIIVLLVIPSAYGVVQLRNLRDVAVNLETVHAGDVSALGQYAAAMAELDRFQRSFVAAADPTGGDPALRSGMHRELARARRELGRVGDAYEEELEPLFGILDSLAVASARIEALVEGGRADQATTYFEGVKPLLDTARAAVRQVEHAIEERGREQVAEARTLSAAAARTTLLTTTIAVLLTAALGLWTTRALSAPLRRLSFATRTVADGEFRPPPGLPYDRSDEIGDLSRSFRTMTERLAELDRLKSEFVGLATHELKTPINVIAGYTELLDEGLYGELSRKQREVLGLVQDQTRSLTLLVNQLLDLSRFEAGGLRVEPEPVPLDQLVREVEGSFRALATQKQIVFDVVRDPDLPTTLVIDHDRIRHEVLSNLLSNAFKFTPSGGRVALEAVAHDGEVHFRVTDSGVGIPADQLERVFEKYYQVEREGRAQGSGLGLAIAKHVVDAHSGRIRAASTEGEGTTFDIFLPLEGPGS
ncbi:MAG: ATP-binding protein [Gemmatimonadota bacterium]